MSVFRNIRIFLIVAALGLVFAACSSGVDAGDAGVPGDQPAEAPGHDDAAAPHDDAEAPHDEAGHDEGVFTFGEPADPTAADRTIEVDANDDNTFAPAEFAVTAGETITFVVTNTGRNAHDFTLGDAATQDEHDAEMAEMMAAGEMGSHDEANAIVVGPGETKEITWHFTEAGHVLIGCHQPGHYAAGMKAEIDVEA
jgi:uncharacterized cupredoxin-like copper-binding protein